MIEFRDVHHYYSKTKKALDCINFKIEKGSFHALIGANGAGKSTIIKLLIRALNLQTGEILINNHNISENQKEDDETILSFFPDSAIFPTGISVLDYIYNEVRIIRDIDKRVLKEKLQNLLNQYEIPDIINKNPNRLSMGQKKKVELIRLMLEDPNIIVLDEPTNYLDVQSRLMLFECLKWFKQKRNATILISSHALHELKEFVDSATIIDNGKIVYTGKVEPEQLISLYEEINSSKLEIFENEKI